MPAFFALAARAFLQLIRGVLGIKVLTRRSGQFPKHWVSMRFLTMAAFLPSLAVPMASAEECTQPSAPIATDRPDTTNSSIVVPVGSLQNENGTNVSRRDGADVFDGTNSRWRLGVAPRFEVLVDLPNYVGTFRGSGPSGFGDVDPGNEMASEPNPRQV
jgi:hypothetical protein